MTEEKKQYLKEYRLKNKEKIAKTAHNYYINNKDTYKLNRKPYNKEQTRLSNKEYYQKNKELIKNRVKKYQLNNKQETSIYNKQWKKDNKHKLKAYKAQRRAAKLKQTPKWADLKAIRLFYLNCPKGYEVDHIIPLQGKNVRGFHVLENLQYLTISENRQKYNKY